MTGTSLFPRRIVQLLAGLFLYGIAIALMVRAGIGVSPWDVLAQGLSIKTGLAFGLITNLVGLAVLAFWIPLRQRPGLGTVLNVLLIGPSAQLGLWLIPQQTALWAQVLVFAAGLVLLAIATGLYIGPKLGPGPRDGLMTGLNARTGWPIWAVRTGIEVTVLVIGWFLGGNVGFGTLAFALLIGPLCSVTLPLFAIRLPEQAATPAPADQDAAPTDVRDGILIEPDAAARSRAADRAASPLVRGTQPDRAPASRPARVIEAHWLDDRLADRAEG